jgi:hypothetical protein
MTNKIETLMRTLFNGDKPPLLYKDRLLERTDMISRNKLYNMMAEDVINILEDNNIIIKPKIYNTLKDTRISLNIDPYDIKYRELGDVDRWVQTSQILQRTPYGIHWNRQDTPLYNKVVNIIKNNYRTAKSGVGGTPVDWLRSIAYKAVKHAEYITDEYFKPILIACDHKQLDEYDQREYCELIEKKEKQEAQALEIRQEHEGLIAIYGRDVTSTLMQRYSGGKIVA